MPVRTPVQGKRESLTTGLCTHVVDTFEVCFYCFIASVSQLRWLDSSIEYGLDGFGGMISGHLLRCSLTWSS